MYLELEKVSNISAKVKLGKDFKDLLHKELCLGMTKYVCQYGTLSDGNEKITSSQRYYQSIKEMYTRAISLENLEADAMEAEADLLDAEKALSKSVEYSDNLRARAKVKRYKNQLTSILVNAEDTLRQYNAFLEVYKELQPEVRAKYPEGIEQAEEDNWIAVAEYRALLKQIGNPVHLTHIPLPKDIKAKIGLASGSPELSAWDIVENKDLILKHYEGDMNSYLEDKYGGSFKCSKTSLSHLDQATAPHSQD